MLNEWADPFPVREFLDLHMMVRCVAAQPQQFWCLRRSRNGKHMVCRCITT